MDKRVLSLIVILATLFLIIIGSFIFISKQNDTNTITINSSNTTSLEENNENKKDTIIIKNGRIENEQLIDEFIEEAVITNNENKELNILQDDKKIKVTYTPGEYAEVESARSIDDGTFESKKKVYGYYTLLVNDEIQGEYPLVGHNIKRSSSNGTIILYFDAPLINYATIPEICRYSLESSGHTRKFEIVYNQRKDLGIKTVFEAEEYAVKTFGGDVDIVIEGDMVYHLEDALNKKVITPDDILEQAKIDMKFGLCEGRFFKDGGSVEYGYNDFTVLKLHTGNGDNDLVIGMRGQIIDLYYKNK